MISSVPRGALQFEKASSASPCDRARFAFTLIEVLVALGIVVALLAIAVPTIVSSFGDRRIEAEAERLAASMASLRAEAVRQRQTLALYLEPAAGPFGGELFIGPLEPREAGGVFADSSGSSGDSEWFAETEDGPRNRSVFEAGRPLTLSIDRPSNDPAQELFGASGFSSAGTGASQPERIRIAICTGSGQMLASRPVWIHDGRSMFSVELNAGVGNAIVSGRQIIPSGEFSSDDPDAPEPESAPPANPSRPSDPTPSAPGGDAP